MAYGRVRGDINVRVLPLMNPLPLPRLMLLISCSMMADLDCECYFDIEAGASDCDAYINEG